MTDLVVFPDAELSILEYLRFYIPGILCDVEDPAGYKASDGTFLRVTRVGGQPRFPVNDQPTLDLEAYGPTRAEAQDLIQLVIAWLAVANNRPPVHAVLGPLDIFTGPQHLPDPVTAEERWQSLVSISVRPIRT